MNVPEIHRALAHDFVDGAEVQHLSSPDEGWVDDRYPKWFVEWQYRRKPKKVKKWRWVFRDHTGKLDITGLPYADYEVASIYRPVQKIDDTMIEVEE